MLYGLFLVIAIAYNFRKFSRERDSFLKSIIEANETSHREMILSHHFHIYIFESFLAIIVAHLITEGALAINLAGIGAIYLALLALGFFIYQYFLKYIEKVTEVQIRATFNHHVIKEFRVSFALIMLPMLLYSAINWAFADSMEGWGSYWLIGLLSNIVFVSVLTILCTVIIMLRLIPNREITETEYLNVINNRLAQIGMPNMRVRWIETDIKNAFVVGLKLLRFSNQTMFVGKRLRTMLTIEEFDAVIAHELAHVANRHIQKRVIELTKNFIMTIFGIFFVIFSVLGLVALYHGEEMVLHLESTATIAMLMTLGWGIFNYALFFDAIRAHEYEADAYAVLELKADPQALESALVKLTEEEIPEYLKTRIKAKRKASWLGRVFSTHPTLADRVASLHHKISHELPFNYYVSSAQKMRTSLGRMLQWKITLPLTAVATFFVVQTAFSIQEGKNLITKIKSSSAEDIKSDLLIAKRINDRPLVVGPTLMHEIVKKNDPELIDHFLKVGANKGKTLYYLSDTKNLDLFAHYYSSYQKQLSQDEYFLILRNTAEGDFTEGYRLMVNSSKFEVLSPDYKADLTRIHQTKKRAPASVE